MLIRDDSDPLIFDTSFVPHLTIDFDDKERAIQKIRFLLRDRAKERKIIYDARVFVALSHIAPEDLELLQTLSKLDSNQSVDLRINIGGRKSMTIPGAAALGNLLRLDLVVGHTITDDESLTYKITDIGRAVAERFVKLSNKQNEKDK